MVEGKGKTKKKKLGPDKPVKANLDPKVIEAGVSPELMENVANYKRKVNPKQALSGSQILSALDSKLAEYGKTVSPEDEAQQTRDELVAETREPGAVDERVSAGGKLKGDISRPLKEPPTRRQEPSDLAGDVELMVPDIGGTYETPEDALLVRDALEGMQPTELKQKLAREILKNRRLSRWVNVISNQYKRAVESGSSTMRAPLLTEEMKNALGMDEDTSTDATVKAVKAIMPTIMQWRLIRDVMKETDEGGAVRETEPDDYGRVKFKMADGTEMEVPSSHVPPWMLGQLFGSGQPRAPDAEKRDDAMVTIKLGDREITAPRDAIGWMYHEVMKTGEKQPTINITGADGVDREVPVNALGAMLDWQRMMGPRTEQVPEKEEQYIEVEDADGRKVRMPVSMYPYWLMTQQQQRAVRPSSGTEQSPAAGGRGMDASLMATLSRMNDTMAKMAVVMDPKSISEMALKGMQEKMNEWRSLREMFGGGGTEDPEIARERIKQEEQTKRELRKEELALKRAEEKTRQTALEAEKLSALMIGTAPHAGYAAPELVGAAAAPQIQRSPPMPTMSDILRRSRDVNASFDDLMQRGKGHRRLGKPFADNELDLESVPVKVENDLQAEDIGFGEE